MITEQTFRIQDVPEHLRRSIEQDLKAERRPLPKHVRLGMRGQVVHYYRPVYFLDPDRNGLKDMDLATVLALHLGAR